jgi:hypothetical protein
MVVKKPSTPARSLTPEKQLAAFLDKFDPAVARILRASRALLRKRLPTADQLIYDNYNFLVIGFCTTPRSSDCMVSLTGASNGVALQFYYGASLPDPAGLLLGSGNQNRFVRLERATTLSDPAIAALIDAAVERAKTPLRSTGKGETIVRSISARQRPRRTRAKPSSLKKRTR